MCFPSSNYTLLIKILYFQRKKVKCLEVNSWGPATESSCVRYSCFHSKSNPPLCLACGGIIWLWLPSAVVVCCGCDPFLLFAEYAVGIVWKEETMLGYVIFSGVFAQDQILRSNLCAPCQLGKGVWSLGREWSHPTVTISTIVPEVFSNIDESLSH